MKTLYVVIGILAVATAVGVGTYRIFSHLKQTSPQVAEATNQPIPVKLHTVAVGNLDQVLGGEATAAGSEQVPVRTMLGTGAVTAVHFKLGDVVKAGQPLFELNGTMYKVQLESARSDLKVARANLEMSRKRVDALKRLQASGLATDDEVRTALLDQASIESRISASVVKEQQAQADIEATLVTSPVSGVVSAGELHPGMVVSGGADLATLTAIHPIRVLVKLGEDKIKHVFSGQDAEVSFYSFPDQVFVGKVAIINPTVDPQTRLVSAIVLIDNPDLKLMPGMSGVAKLKSKHEGALVPSVALISAAQGGAYVFVVDDKNVARIRPVTTGASADGYVEILSGLKAGERVVVVGQTALHDNQTVRVGTDYENSKH